MAWTSPLTWAVGQLVTASQLNTHIRDNLLETAAAKVTTAGDTIYATGANALARLGIGSSGKVLKVASGVPAWADAIERGGLARSNSDYALTTTMATLPNCSISVGAGTWLVLAGVTMKDMHTDNAQQFAFRLRANGVAQSGRMEDHGSSGSGRSYGSLMHAWEYTSAGTETLELQGSKAGGAGTSGVFSTYAWIVAIRMA